jgi:CRP/FNR family transcriptional regulator
MDKLSILGRFSFYREAPSSFQSEVAAAAEYASLSTGAYFYREGTACGDFGLVGCGDIRVFKTGETGREITLYHVQDGQPCLVNMLCVFLGRPAMASAVVELPTEAVVIPAAEFRDWMRNSHAVRSFVFETMAGRFVDVMTLVEEIAFRNMDRRVAELLVRRFSPRGIPLRQISATHEELAAELGTAREVVSRLLKEFERLGAITLARGRIELKDEAALRHLAHP